MRKGVFATRIREDLGTGSSLGSPSRGTSTAGWLTKMILGGSFFRPWSPACSFSTTSRAASSRSREMGMLHPAISVFRKVFNFSNCSGLASGNLASVTLTS